ncbi:MAG: SCO family protein [Devosia indica]
MRTHGWTVALWISVVAVGLVAMVHNFFETEPAHSTASTLGRGDYALLTTQGEAFTADTLVGGPSMLFFGFTHCPEVCPTSLAEMTAWYESLGAEGDGLDAWFISVDPARDTIKLIQDYVGWTERVVGVTGTEVEVAKAAASWGVYYQEVPLDGGNYTIDHTASVFLVDAQGEFAGTINYREPMESAVTKLRSLLAQPR